MPTLTSAHDLITAVPFLIGFKPADSLVLISIRGGEIGMAMRIDIPPAISTDEIDMLVQHFRRDEAESALLVAYMPTDRSDGDLLLITIGAALIREGITIQESIVVADGRYRSIICRDPSCCPPHGLSMPTIEESLYAAEHVIAGIPMPYENISELIGSISSTVGFDESDWCAEVSHFAIDESLDDETELGILRRDGVDAMQLLLDEFRIGRGPTDRNLCARLIGRMSDVQVRDFALGIHDEDSYDLYFAMWRELLRISPPGFIAPIACIVAAMAYEGGDGALAQKAVDRAIEDGESYPLAGLLRRVFNAGWPPQSFAQMRADLHPRVVATIFNEGL